jgi:serine/threonine protein phosphatase PrpC
MDQSTVRLRVANITDIGKNPARTKNEDSFGYYEGEFGRLFLICDGMGGHVAGDVASRIAVESIRQYFETNYIPGAEEDTIRQSVEFAQNKILEATQHDPSLSGMGTTLVLLLIKGTQYWHAHSGDSRLYLSRGGSLNRLTKDHSQVQELVESGVISLEQTSSHPLRNIVTRSLGHTDYEPDLSGPHKLRQDDVFLLCSDGLTEHLKDEELLLQMEEEPSIACRNLVDLANGRGGSDNVTIQIVHVQQCTPFTLSQEVSTPPKKNFKPNLAILATILVFLGATLWYSLSLSRFPSGPPAPRQEAEAATEEEETPAREQLPLSPELERKIDNRLVIREPLQNYQDFFDTIRSDPRQAQQLKFMLNPRERQMVYVIPGKTIYLAYGQLQDNGLYGMRADEIQALIALALVASEKGSDLDEENWETQLFSAATQPVDDHSYARARELYEKYDARNAAVLFASDNRFGKFRPLIKMGNYNFSIDIPGN